jgi:hypothetical protein
VDDTIITFRPLRNPEAPDPEGKDPVWTDYGPGTITINDSAIEWRDGGDKYVFDIEGYSHLTSTWSIVYFKAPDRSIPPREGWLWYHIDFMTQYPEGDEPDPCVQVTPEFAARKLREEGAEVPSSLAEMVSQRALLFQQPKPLDPRPPVICDSQAGLCRLIGKSPHYTGFVERWEEAGRIKVVRVDGKLHVWFTDEKEHQETLEKSGQLRTSPPRLYSVNRA